MVEDTNELREAIKKVQGKKIPFSMNHSKPRVLEVINNLLLQLLKKENAA